VALTAIAVDFDKTFYVQTLNPTQVSLDLIVAGFLDFFTKFGNFVVGELVHSSCNGNVQLLANFFSRSPANAVDIGKRDVAALVLG
jgi:hypothetical protein